MRATALTHGFGTYANQAMFTTTSFRIIKGKVANTTDNTVVPGPMRKTLHPISQDMTVTATDHRKILRHKRAA